MSTAKDERGTVTLLVAMMMVVLTTVSAFALDLGMQRVGRRDMQALADVVALDLARRIDGRTGQQIESDSTWAAAQNQSVQRNADTVGQTPRVTAELGTLLPNGAFQALALPSAIPTAVKVTASTSVDFVFASAEEGDASRSAVAAAVKSACFSVGSYAARFRSGDSALVQTLLAPMNAFLRPQANIDAISYQGLAVAAVSLNEIAADSHVGTVDELLTSNVTVDNLLRASIAALNRQSPQNSVALSALNQILNGQANLSTPILLTKVLNISPTDAAALETKINVLDLITGAVLIADGEHAVSVPNLSAGIGNLAPVTASLKVIEGAQIACGAVGSPEAVARTSQIRGDMTMKLQLPSINQVTGIQGVIQTPESTVVLGINVGNAEGTLVAPGPVCNAGTAVSPDEETVSVRSGLATFNLDTTLNFAGKLSIPVLNLLGVQIGTQLVDVTFDQAATANLAMPDSTGTANLRVPPNDTVPISTGSSSALGHFTVSTTATNVVAKIAGVTVTAPATLALVNTALQPVTAQLAVNNSVVSPLNSLVDSVNDLISPLRTLLGLTVSGADVYAVGRPTCNGSVLRG